MAVELSTKKIHSLMKAKQAGYHNDLVTRGLYLSVSPTGTASWVYRYKHPQTKRPKEMGLGSFSDISLAAARDAAIDARRMVRDGCDPLEAKRKAKAEKLSAKTFRAVAEEFLEVHLTSLSNDKHRAQWRMTLETYAYPHIGDMLIQNVETADIQRMLKPLWQIKHETATRLRQRVEKVLGYATALGLRSGENPARWKSHLETVMPKPESEAENFKSLPYPKAPGFMIELAAMDGISARALELIILTGLRTQELIYAEWSEINFKSNVWTVPAERMKGAKRKSKAKRRDHRIPLCSRAVSLLKGLRGLDEKWVFPSSNLKGDSLNKDSMAAVLRRMGYQGVYTVHGMRSTLRTWADDKTDYPYEVKEMALEHSLGSQTEQAYNRAELFDKRKDMMNDWGEYLYA